MPMPPVANAEMLAYTRYIDIDGDMLWVIFDDEGNPMAACTIVTGVLSFAATHEYQVLTIH